MAQCCCWCLYNLEKPFTKMVSKDAMKRATESETFKNQEYLTPSVDVEFILKHHSPDGRRRFFHLVPNLSRKKHIGIEQSGFVREILLSLRIFLLAQGLLGVIWNSLTQPPWLKHVQKPEEPLKKGDVLTTGTL
ncbi:hypothetical protein CDAR_69701 [Caerostris darwini]|uniref:Fumarylacetoacetase n=1 Tax=Caerostris darwini TaxID=1538125 RepID=A0AAV4U0V0_9ARAC|nr:hypothetical protein CDAR_69701 [Caerostris darwini]